MIKVLYIFHVSEVGGGSLCLLNIIKELDKTKYLPVVLLKNNGPLVEELQKLNVEVIINKLITPMPYNQSIFKFSSIKAFFFVLIAILNVKAQIRKINPDIVHINSMMLYPFIFPAKELKKKIIIHVREHWPKDEHRLQFYFAKSIIAKYADRIIAINITSSSLLNLSEQTFVIYDWIDFSDRSNFYDLKLVAGIDIEKDKILLYLGGFQKIKGVFEIITTFTNHVKDRNIKLLVVGVEDFGSNVYTIKLAIKKILGLLSVYSLNDKLRQAISKDPRIICVPPTLSVKSLLEQSFCLVSFPTVPHAILPIAESISLGTPVISADTPEAREYSNNGESAMLVGMGNTSELKDAILYAIDNEDDMRNRTKCGRKKIKRKFEINRNVSSLHMVYSSLI